MLFQFFDLLCCMSSCLCSGSHQGFTLRSTGFRVFMTPWKHMWYFVYSGTPVLIIYLFRNLWLSAETDQYRTSDEWWSIFSCAVVVWLTEVLASATSSWAGAECWNIFFSSKCNEYRVWPILNLTSTTNVWLYLLFFWGEGLQLPMIQKRLETIALGKFLAFALYK